MIGLKNIYRVVFLSALFVLVTNSLCLAEGTKGVTETTPSRAQYFSWIADINNGGTEYIQTQYLNFFKWMQDEYGMTLDIYALDAGQLDGQGYYHLMTDEYFKTRYPNGFDPLYRIAHSMGTKLGVWLGPDGYGNTAAEEQARRDMLVKLCRDYNFGLLKFDGNVLRPEKQQAFINTMILCRTYQPDLIALNHRLNLGSAEPYVTTHLWDGRETYIDVWMANDQTAPHHRAAAISRGLTNKLTRLTEDHGVCLSSSLDYWEDDLVLQAFSRNLILAPQTYGNPWLLNDSEFSKLARIYNLHRRYRDILVSGKVLGSNYGPNAVSRGNDSIRFVTLRNLTWNPVTYNIKLDADIGLNSTSNPIELRMFHPYEKIIGKYSYGTTVSVEVLPFRSCLVAASSEGFSEFGVSGASYEIVNDKRGKPVVVNLLSFPGTTAVVRLSTPNTSFTNATLDGQDAGGILSGSLNVTFEGTPYADNYHRKLGNLVPVPVPSDAEALYEATCFAADSNALEVRSLKRSGPSNIAAVNNARNALFERNDFVSQGIWDKYAFDSNSNTKFMAKTDRINGGAFRLDFGSSVSMTKLVLVNADLKPNKVEFSNNLGTWTDSASIVQNGNNIEIDIPSSAGNVQYARMVPPMTSVAEIEGYNGNTKLDRANWRASNLFAPYESAPTTNCWSYSFTLNEIPRKSYLAIPVAGNHGEEKVYAAIRVDGKPMGAPDRARSYRANPWEYHVATTGSNYTYYVPLTEDMINKKIDVVLLGLSGVGTSISPEVWITSYPIPFVSKTLVLSGAFNVSPTPAPMPTSTPAPGKIPSPDPPSERCATCNWSVGR
jgi:hypothetical protein